MSNYYAACRSNYLKVKDPDAFKVWADSSQLEVWEHNGTFAIGGADPDGAGWPSAIYDEAKGEYTEINVAGELQAHLADGQVAILMESGAEGARYIVGVAQAITPGKPVITISLDDIYEIASEQFGIEPNTITACEY